MPCTRYIPEDISPTRLTDPYDVTALLLVRNRKREQMGFSPLNWVNLVRCPTFPHRLIPLQTLPQAATKLLI
jgi:hypothetical protein